MAKEKEYAMYKGEKLLIIGTITEIAKHLGVTKKTVLSTKHQHI